MWDYSRPLRWLLCLVSLGGLSATARAQRWQRDAVLSQVLVKHLARDTAGFLWVGTDEGVARYDGVELVPLNNLRQPLSPRLPRGSVQGLVTDTAGTLWIGSTAGLFRFLPTTDKLTRVPLPAATTGEALEVHLLWQHPRTNGETWHPLAKQAVRKLHPTPQGVTWLQEKNQLVFYPIPGK
ncbi:hypothetical protein DNI29_21460 [Hymenobacter sediminis]|uniref:hypothetical protein n=1 Tax=Hymenobacter sediminis TaxID=2218621 RepID=UPI000DA66109|nr:hypothetical protein [Hymenobacter sediminis]RPD44282.1 hypothetical protein DNI29_21460 [Hymenobacter sediminis]